MFLPSISTSKSIGLVPGLNYYNTFRITSMINVTAGYRSFNFNSASFKDGSFGFPH
jgi:hypothetical protein